MKDTIEINLRALTGRHRDNIAKVLDEALNDIDDDTNEEALEIINNYTEN